MILLTTHIKLLKKDATIYRMDTQKTIVMGQEIPATTEHFTTTAGAQKAVDHWKGCGIDATFCPVKASQFDPMKGR